jgi:hypothetical protein
VKQVKNAYASTVNHVVLAACAGALRRYLGAHGEIPEQPLVAAVPMALAERPATGSAIRSRRCSCACRCSSQIRSTACARRARRASTRCARQELIGNQLNEWADLVSPALLAGASQLYTRLGLADYHAPLVNLVISNVPGPAMPLYCAGSRVTACHPLGPIYNGCALNLTVMSYNGSLGVGAIGCPDTVPDLAEIPRAFESEVAELLQIAHGGAATIAARRPSARAIAPFVRLQPVVERLQADPEHVRGALLLAVVVERREREDALDLLVRHPDADPEVLAAVRRRRHAGRPASEMHSASTSVSAMMNARSITLRSSRTLPGQL